MHKENVRARTTTSTLIKLSIHTREIYFLWFWNEKKFH